MMNKRADLKYKEFIRLSWLFLTGGFIIFLIGIIRFVFFSPGLGINIKTQQPVVLNGSLLIILGLGFFLIGVYRVTNKNKAFQKEKENEEEIKEIEEKQRRKSMGY
jgi:uncharacterized membrane protein YiaA